MSEVVHGLMMRRERMATRHLAALYFSGLRSHRPALLASVHPRVRHRVTPVEPRITLRWAPRLWSGMETPGVYCCRSRHLCWGRQVRLCPREEEQVGGLQGVGAGLQYCCLLHVLHHRVVEESPLVGRPLDERGVVSAPGGFPLVDHCARMKRAEEHKRLYGGAGWGGIGGDVTYVEAGVQKKN